jgi:hypothetical protein
MIVSLLALAAALAGTAIAGPDAISNKLTKAKVKTIAAKQIKKLGPELSVAHANEADQADRADEAASATSAGALEGFTVVATGTIAGPGTVAVDACDGQTASVPGLRSDDHVILTPPEGWQTHEVTLMPFVAAPGFLEYTMCNHSGGSGTAFNEALRFMVLR